MHVSVGILHYVCTIWLSVQYEINTCVRHQQVYACICRYSALWQHYVQYSELCVGCVSKERLRKPFRGTLTQIWFYSHSLFKWQGQGSHWARPWPTCWCRTGDIHHRLWGWQVHALCSNLALAVMGWVHIIRLHIVMNTAQRHCHSKCQCAFLHIPTWYIQDTCRYMHIPTFHT